MNTEFAIKTGKEERETLTTWIDGGRMLTSITFTLEDLETNKSFNLKTITSFDTITAFDIIRYLKNWLPGTKRLKTGVSLNESISFCDAEIVDNGELVDGKKMRIYRPAINPDKKPQVALTILTKKQADAFIKELEKYINQTNDTSSPFIQKKLDVLEKRADALEMKLNKVLKLIAEWEENEDEEQYKEPPLVIRS